MKKEVRHSETSSIITCGDHFAVMERKPDATGLQGVTFSFGIRPRIADQLEQSGIVRVERFTSNGTIRFRRKNFYTNEKMHELIMDLLEKKHAE